MSYYHYMYIGTYFKLPNDYFNLENFMYKSSSEFAEQHNLEELLTNNKQYSFFVDEENYTFFSEAKRIICLHDLIQTMNLENELQTWIIQEDLQSSKYKYYKLLTELNKIKEDEYIRFGILAFYA